MSGNTSRGVGIHDPYGTVNIYNEWKQTSNKDVEFFLYLGPLCKPRSS